MIDDDKSQKLIEFARLSLEGLGTASRFSDGMTKRATERAERAEAKIVETLGIAVELKSKLQQERARFEADCADRHKELDIRERAVAEREKAAAAEASALTTMRQELEAQLAKFAAALA